MRKIMLYYRLDERRRLGRTMKRQFDGVETGLSRPNSWRLITMMMWPLLSVCMTTMMKKKAGLDCLDRNTAWPCCPLPKFRKKKNYYFYLQNKRWLLRSPSKYIKWNQYKCPRHNPGRTRSNPRPQRKSKTQQRSGKCKTVWRRPTEWQLCQIPTKSADSFKGRGHTIRAAALKHYNINMRILVIIAVALFDMKDRNNLPC